MTDLKRLMEMQQKFSDNVYDARYIDEAGKQELLKTLCLSLHSEATNISMSSDFKKHEDTRNLSLDKDNLIYHTVDAMRYLFAILNLYNISAEDVLSAYMEKDASLLARASLKKPTNSQKVIIVDIDDVLCEFRNHFNMWLKSNFDIDVDKNSTSYYSSKEVLAAGLSPERVFEEFIAKDGFANIPVINETKDFLLRLKQKGYFIQLLTSRPDSNLKCKYQTYLWLKENEIFYDNISFSPEKYLWLSKKNYFIEGRVVCAIDDSAKHAMEYATHDIMCYVPTTSYNKDTQHENITHYSFNDYDKILCNF